MKKVWTVKLQKSYDVNTINYKLYVIIADNAKDAIDRALIVHRKEYHLGASTVPAYRYPTEVHLSSIAH